MLLGSIAFVRAMFKHADVLYADELTASLDRANRQMVIDLIRQRANEGRPSSLRPMTTIWQRLRTKTLPWEVSQDSSQDISCYSASCPQYHTMVSENNVPFGGTRRHLVARLEVALHLVSPGAWTGRRA